MAARGWKSRAGINRAGLENGLKKLEEGYKPLKGDMGPGMGMGVEVRIHRGAGVDYVQKGPPESKELKTTDPDDTVEVAGFVLVNELDGDLQEYARNWRVGGKIER